MQGQKLAELKQFALAGNATPRTAVSLTLADSVLRLLWREQEISRADIARRTGLARSTVSEIVAGLLEAGLATEVGPGVSRGGRRPIVLRFEDNARTILGIEMGAAHVAVALTDLRGRVLAWKERHHAVRTDPTGTRALLVELCNACLAAHRGAARRLLGVGVAVACPIDPRHPDRLSEIVLPHWGGLNGFDHVFARYGVPWFVDNDANMGALAEGWWGAGRGVDDFAYVKVATGVGSGHVVGGEIYRGATGVAGEIGHVSVDPHGPPCICGLRGCLATLVGAPALVQKAKEMLQSYEGSVLAGGDPTIESIEDAALAGDPLALALAQEAATHLGIALVGMLNLMNPARVILGGGLARLGEILLEPIRETVRLRTRVTGGDPAEIRTSELGPQAGAVGAATLVLTAALADTQIFASHPSS